MAGSFKYKLGVNEFKEASKQNSIYRALIAEYLGTLLLNFFGCASCVLLNKEDGDYTVGISLSFGLAVFMAVMSIGHVSGGHINPAVTVAMLVTGRVSLVRAFFYIVAQVAGAISGTACLKAVLPDELQGALGLTALSSKILPVQGLGIEFFLGFVLIFVVFGVCDENKPDARFVGPLAIGLTVTLGHLTCVKWTGASMNPARSLGSAVLMNSWEHHWVYWIGPILGGIGASLLYTQALAAPVPEVDLSERYRTNADEKEMRRLDGKYDA